MVADAKTPVPKASNPSNLTCDHDCSPPSHRTPRPHHFRSPPPLALWASLPVTIYMHKIRARASDVVQETQHRPPTTARRQMTTPRHQAASPPVAVLTLLWLLLLLGAPAAAQQQSPSRDKDNGDGGGGMPGQSPSFSAPMVVLLVALIAAFLFIGFFSVYMRRCGRGDSAGPAITAAALLALSREEQRNQQQRSGLDAAVVASFPTMRYADAKQLRVGGKDAALECAVCLSEFEDDEELRLLPSCSHAFHPDCIGEWLAGHVTCPVCRCSLDPEETAAADAAGSGEATGETQQQQDQVAIDVSHGGAEEEEEERRREEAMELERIGSQRRALRSRSGRPAAPPVPRSHSTGHSLAARLDGDLERFTLRLPEHVRREMVAAAGEESLRRTGPRDARGGARSARLGRSDRWPSFIGRTFSSRVPFWSASRRAPDLDAAAVAAGTTTTTTTGAATRARRDKTGGASADGSVTPAKGSVRFDCLGVGPAVTGTRVGAAAGDSETEEDDDDEEKAIARQRLA